MLADNFADPFIFAAAAFILFYIPGDLLQRASGISLEDGLSEAALRLSAGLVAMPVLYQLMRRLETPNSLMLAVLLLVIGFWIFRLRGFDPGKWRVGECVSLLIGLLFIGILLGFSHFADFRLGDGGSYYQTTLLTESTFHQGLVNSLIVGFPPPALYAAGSVDFAHYHLNMHLQIEGLHRLTGIGTDRLVFWYFPFLYFLLLFLLPYAFVRKHGGSLVPALVAGAMGFGAGFSFIPGLMGFADSTFAWAQFFHPAILGIYTLNGVLPALLALYIILLTFPGASIQKPTGYWLVIGLIIFGSYGLKSSMGFQISGVFLAVGLARYLLGDRGSREWAMAACGAICLALMLLDLTFLRSSLGGVFAEFRLWHSLDVMLTHFGLSEVHTLWKPGLFLLFLVLTLGVRNLGLLTLRGTLKQRPETTWLVRFLLLFFISGYVLADVLYLGDSSAEFNHATWFAVQGLFASWFFLFLYMARIDGGKLENVLTLVLLLTLALPSTAQLLWLKSDSELVFIGPDEQQVVDYLANTDLDSVVMHPLNQNQPSLASNLAGRSSVLNIHKSFVNETEGLEKRAIGVLMFFNRETDAETRESIMNYYGVTHVYGPRSLDTVFEGTSSLERVLSNDSYSVWLVHY